MKSIFVSKTFWFNFLTVATVVATMNGYVPDQQLADRVSGILLALSPIVNIVLRWYTSKPVYVMP